MKTALTHSFLALSMSVSSVWAKDPIPPIFVGEWTVKWQCERRPQGAVFKLDGQGQGQWRTLGRSRTDGCVGLAVPLETHVKSENEIRVVLKFSEALHGCADAMIRLRAASDGVVSGGRGQANPVALTLSRK